MLNRWFLKIFLMLTICVGIICSNNSYIALSKRCIKAYKIDCRKLEDISNKLISSEEELIKCLNGDKEYSNIEINTEIVLNGGKYKILEETNIIIGMEGFINIVSDTEIDGMDKLTIIGINNNEYENKKPRQLIKKAKDKKIFINNVLIKYVHKVEHQNIVPTFSNSLEEVNIDKVDFRFKVKENFKNSRERVVSKIRNQKHKYILSRVDRTKSRYAKFNSQTQKNNNESVLIFDDFNKYTNGFKSLDQNIKNIGLKNVSNKDVIFEESFRNIYSEITKNTDYNSFMSKFKFEKSVNVIPVVVKSEEEIVQCINDGNPALLINKPIFLKGDHIFNINKGTTFFISKDGVLVIDGNININGNNMLTIKEDRDRNSIANESLIKVNKDGCLCVNNTLFIQQVISDNNTMISSVSNKDVILVNNKFVGKIPEHEIRRNSVFDFKDSNGNISIFGNLINNMDAPLNFENTNGKIQLRYNVFNECAYGIRVKNTKNVEIMDNAFDNFNCIQASNCINILSGNQEFKIVGNIFNGMNCENGVWINQDDMEYTSNGEIRLNSFYNGRILSNNIEEKFLVKDNILYNSSRIKMDKGIEFYASKVLNSRTNNSVDIKIDTLKLFNDVQEKDVKIVYLIEDDNSLGISRYMIKEYDSIKEQSSEIQRIDGLYPNNNYKITPIVILNTEGNYQHFLCNSIDVKRKNNKEEEISIDRINSGISDLCLDLTLNGFDEEKFPLQLVVTDDIGNSVIQDIYYSEVLNSKVLVTVDKLLENSEYSFKIIDRNNINLTGMIKFETLHIEKI